MQIDYTAMAEVENPHFQNGEGSCFIKGFSDEALKANIMRLKPGCSIGMHTHSVNREIAYIISGTGKTVCDGKEARLRPGMATYCPRGVSHTIINDGSEDLVFFAVIPNI